MKIGCHVSNSGKMMLEGAILEALSYQANCFMIYLGAPQNSYRKNVNELRFQEMKKILKENNMNIEDVITHAPYIVNLAQPDDNKRQFAIDFLTREIKNVHLIGAKYFVFHPGAYVNSTLEEGLINVIKSIKTILENTKDTNVIMALETMSGKGTECCFNFNQIKKIIEGVNDKRLKVCFDSCHTFDAGYDLVNNYEGVFQEFDDIIGLEEIVVFHINDSKNLCGGKKDRHENIGFGNIGFETLVKFFYDERFSKIPKILETPYVTYGDKDKPPYKYEIDMIRNKKFDSELIEKIRRG